MSLLGLLGLGFGASAGGAVADPPLSIGTLTCYGTDGLPEGGVTIYVQLRVGPGTDGYALDAAILALTSAVTTGIVTHDGFIRNSTYRARRGLSGRWITFDVPDAGSFTMPEVLGAP